MQSSICTLFEGNYHYGLGALTNSLYKYGFKGTIWAGYRGELPFWAKPLKQQEKYKVFQVTADCQIHFVALDTNYHFTNYKPTFMLDLWKEYEEIDRLFYFDPDIVIKCAWSFFERWTEEHIALCEDINSPLNANAPERIAWKKLLQKRGIVLNSKLYHYINGGFVGLGRANKHFVESWKNILDIVAEETEPLDISFLPNLDGKQSQRSITDPFYATEQDALNCAAMKHEQSLSIANKKAMDFGSFGYIMSHALGGHKPWQIQYLKNALDGRSVSISHKLYWQNTQAPISLYSKQKLKQKQLAIKLATFINYFYAR